MKKLVKRLLSFAGIGVYRLNSSPPPNVPNAQGLEIKSPIHHNTQERLNEFYGGAKFVAAYLDQKRLDFYIEVIELLRTTGVDYQGKDIADVGCGTGHLLLGIKNNSQPSSLTGFEFAEAALKIAREILPSAQFHFLDLYRIDETADKQFDVIFCVEVFEHLLYPDKALMNLVQMMRPGAVTMITVPNGRIDTFEGHINFWSPESWDVFIKAGCDGLAVETGLLADDTTNYAIIRRSAVQ